jgi:hypothetical protein
MNPLTHLRGAFYLLVLVAVSAIPFALAQRNATSHTFPATIILVTNTNDSGPGSLRNALSIANDGDTIDATGVSGTILLTSGGLLINRSVTINGPGAANLAVNGNATFTVFNNLALNVTISGFTITNGVGGGIYNQGVVTLSDSSVVSNVDGGFLNPGCDSCNETATITNSTVSGNSGSGIFNGNNSGLTVSNSTISGNSTTGNGGGIATVAGGSNGGESTVTVSTALSAATQPLATAAVFTTTAASTAKCC